MAEQQQQQHSSAKHQSYRRSTTMPSVSTSASAAAKQQQQAKKKPSSSKGNTKELAKHQSIGNEREEGGTPSTTKSASPKVLKKSHSEDLDMRRKKQLVDRFGFIVNTDKQQQQAANNNNTLNSSSSHRQTTPDGKIIVCVDEPLTAEEAKRSERREKKWTVMMQSWDSVNKKRHKLVLNRLRKGLPDAIRGNVWKMVGNVPRKIQENPGVYKKILKRIEQDTEHMDGGNGDTKNKNKNNSNAPPEGPHKGEREAMTRSPSFQNIQETIERDIHRTYPRHHLFYDDHKDEEFFPGSSAIASNTPPTSPPQPLTMDADDDDVHQSKLGSLCNEDLQSLIRELESPTSSNNTKDDAAAAAANNNGGKASATTRVSISPAKKKCSTLLNSIGGQGALRRVLRAYSYYDREVGYCQGMNFIAAMFITLMSEEESFWLLVAVMQDNPCHMRGLFGEGMKETHKVLYVAEKLIHQFLPKLARHLDKENVHVTMYATQWLLTQYTSSFNFDLVTRVWDVFLCEGWKITYRVMLGLLQHIQPTLLKMTFEEILGFFRDLPDKIDGDVIMETSLKIPLKTKHIEKLESDFRQQQERDQR